MPETPWIINVNISSNKHPVYLNDFSDILLYRLRISEKSELKRYAISGKALKIG